MFPSLTIKTSRLKKLKKLSSTRIWRSKLTNEDCENQGRPGGRRNTRNVEKRLRERSGVDTRTSKVSEIQKISLLGTAHILRKCLDESLRVLVVLGIHPSPVGRSRGIM